MKMWAVKTVHPPERGRKFNRYKRLILAFLISAVLTISMIYMGGFPPIAQSDSGSNSSSFKIYIENATMTNVRIEGPYTYNSLNVTRVTADVANLSKMLLVKEGSMLELEAPSAFATKLLVYTTYLTGWILVDHYPLKMESYGNTTVDPPLSFPEVPLIDMYMEAVYLQAESFSASWLSVTCT